MVLRPGEGNAVILSCGGQSLLLPLGDDADREDLEEYLDRQQLSPIEYVITTGQEMITLGDAVCEIEQTGQDTMLLTVTHAENNLRLSISQNALPELWLNDEAPTTLETDHHSVRILSDGTRFTIRPDFSAWNE